MEGSKTKKMEEVIDEWRSTNMESRWCYNDVRVEPSTRGNKKTSFTMTFAKFGKVVDVYIVTKKDAKTKCFAFVRFKKVVVEHGLEKTLQGVKCGGRIQYVNIVMFERKPAGAPSKCRNVRSRLDPSQGLCPLDPARGCRPLDPAPRGAAPGQCTLKT
ncbi:unnamed protein product [Lactuca saligna]|uniref:RRM domain-containing protein n=1 Tax=Lactuca saligna TaxID=75948 RepID=A0AA36E6S4_LACSI|nr:unnamed protein product [Lactuca saligna]